MESGKDLSYWPGFVDALSNVVLTLVFVLVVFVFALVMASNKVEQKVLELAEQARQREELHVQTDLEREDLRRELRELLKQLQRREAEIAKLREEIESLKRNQVPNFEELNALKDKVRIEIDTAKQAKAAGDNTAEVDRDTGVIVIVFPRGVFEVNDKAKAELDRALAAQQIELAGMQIAVRSVPGVETYSEARRLAYYRGLNIRNYLIDKGLGTGRTIEVSIVQTKEIGDGRVEIRFRRR